MRRRRVAGDPLHAPRTGRERLLRDAGAGDRPQHGLGEVGRLLPRVERCEPGGAPVGRRRAVQAERRARAEQRQRAEPAAVGERRVLRDHAAERQADQVRAVLRFDRVGQPGDGVGERGERHRAGQRRRGAVAGQVPGRAAAAVGQLAQLVVPRRPAAAEPVQEDRRGRAASRPRATRGRRARCPGSSPSREALQLSPRPTGRRLARRRHPVGERAAVAPVSRSVRIATSSSGRPGANATTASSMARRRSPRPTSRPAR